MRGSGLAASALRHPDEAGPTCCSFAYQSARTAPNVRAAILRGGMASVVRVSVAWVLFGAIAAVVTYGPALLRIVALGPISLANVLVT